MITSVLEGFPTLLANISGGNKGRYRAVITTRIEKIISIIGTFPFDLSSGKFFQL